ncbi:MAG: hypothetical protein QOH06_452 [Acidobacteriota bacterium]|jgi:hypothetical protein|nr:hypothetical protein [Acidobacteriota bacterium]
MRDIMHKSTEPDEYTLCIANRRHIKTEATNVLV